MKSVQIEQFGIKRWDTIKIKNYWQLILYWKYYWFSEYEMQWCFAVMNIIYTQGYDFYFLRFLTRHCQTRQYGSNRTSGSNNQMNSLVYFIFCLNFYSVAYICHYATWYPMRYELKKAMVIKWNYSLYVSVTEISLIWREVEVIFILPWFLFSQ